LLEVLPGRLVDAPGEAREELRGQRLPATGEPLAQPPEHPGALLTQLDLRDLAIAEVEGLLPARSHAASLGCFGSGGRPTVAVGHRPGRRFQAGAQLV